MTRSIMYFYNFPRIPEVLLEVKYLLHQRFHPHLNLRLRAEVVPAVETLLKEEVIMLSIQWLKLRLLLWQRGQYCFEKSLQYLQQYLLQSLQLLFIFVWNIIDLIKQYQTYLISHTTIKRFDVLRHIEIWPYVPIKVTYWPHRMTL